VERSPVDRDALEAFVAVARAGTVRAAADGLGRTQPSISARIATLEAAWGVRLFYRRPRGMRTTPEGERLLPLAARALAAFEAVDRDARGAVAADDEVRVGAGDALGRVVLPTALRRLQREHPAASFRIVEGPGTRLLDALRGGRIDVALVAAPDPGSDDDARDLEVEPLVESPVVLLVPASTSSARTAVRLSTLATRRLVTLHPGSTFRAGLERAFARAGVPFRPAVEVGSLSLVRRYVAAGLGVAPVPEVAFRGREASTGVRPATLDGVPPAVYRVVRRAAAPLSPPARRLIDLLHDTASGPPSGSRRDPPDDRNRPLARRR
jgi:DNA-binding transcriptional LysR family regulator